MSDQPSRFRIIEGGGKPKRTRARKAGQAELLECWQCEADIGVSTTTTMEVKRCRMVRNGKAEGGTKAIICVHCMARGKVTVLLG